MNVGDKVRIKIREHPRDWYPASFTDAMTQYSGNVYTIREKREYHCSEDREKEKRCDGHIYHLEEIGWTWTSAMFDPVDEPTLSKKSGSAETINLKREKRERKLNFNL